MAVPAAVPSVPSPPPVPALDSAAWAAQTFGAAVLGDRRRTRRLVRTAAAIAAQPAASLPQQLRQPAALKATYRLLHEAAVTPAALLAPHLAQTRAAAATTPVTLLVQDTTDLDFTAHRATSDLGPIGDGRGRGLLLQSVLAVAPTGAVLGLLASEPFCRQPAPRRGERCAERQERPRESEVWGRLVDQVGRPPPRRRWVHVGDRGSDLFAFPIACQAQGCQVLVRVAQNRRITTDDGTVTHLVTYARTRPVVDERELALPRQPARGTQPARPARTAQVAVAWAAVTIQPPHHSRQQVPLTAWVIRTWEPHPPPGVAPLEWVLLTTVSTTTAAAAWERVDW